MKKRWLALFLMVCLVALAAGAHAASPSDFGMVTNETYLNLRSGPSLNDNILGKYNKGTFLTILSTVNSGSWHYVQGPDGKVGYVDANFVSKGPEVPTAVAIVNNPKAGSFLNFRAQPSYDAKVIDILYNGVPALFYSRHGGDGGWYYVSINGVYGYLRGEFLTTASMLATDVVATVTTPNNTGLNLRQGPGTEYGVMEKLSGGSYVTVLLKGASWSKVSLVGAVGFVDNSFLTFGIVKPGGVPSNPGASQGNGYALVNNPVSGQLLNLRQTPSTAAKVVGHYMNGTRVTVLHQGSEWCEVVVDKTGTYGFMMTKYLKLYNLPNKPTAQVNHPMRSFVNMRKSMSMNAVVLMRVSHGKTVEVLIPGADWCKVKVDGTTGYMVSSFLIY